MEPYSQRPRDKIAHNRVECVEVHVLLYLFKKVFKASEKIQIDT